MVEEISFDRKLITLKIHKWGLGEDGGELRLWEHHWSQAGTMGELSGEQLQEFQSRGGGA